MSMQDFSAILASIVIKISNLMIQVLAKVKTMKANKKADAAILTEGFKIATAGLTKVMVQNVRYTSPFCLMSSHTYY